MNRHPQADDDEHDALWDLLAQAPPPAASPRFASETVRAARLASQPKPWWLTWLRPAPIAGLAMATAAIAMVATHFLGSPVPGGASQLVTVPAQHATLESIQELAATEALLAATDRLDDFSDQELACLIGF